MMQRNDEIYIKNRNIFLQTLSEKLGADERFAAAWLTGSFSRQEQDTLSDIDLTLVVFDDQAQTLCARPEMVSAETSKERLDLFSLFGKPAFIHENNHNAPEGGTFTFTAYEQNAIMVDWVLRPLASAERPDGSLLLFEKVKIPVEAPAQPESQAQRAEQASEMMAFFWMMTAVTVKYISRGDDMFVNAWLEELTNMVSGVERRIQGQTWRYQRGSRAKLCITADEQIQAIRQLCEKMEKLKAGLVGLGGYAAEAPLSTIEILIRVAQEKAEIQ